MVEIGGRTVVKEGRTVAARPRRNGEKTKSKAPPSKTEGRAPGPRCENRHLGHPAPQEKERKKERKKREIPLCAGRPFHRSERGRKSRPAPFGMTEGVGANRTWIGLGWFLRRGFGGGGGPV